MLLALFKLTINFNLLRLLFQSMIVRQSMRSLKGLKKCTYLKCT